MTSYERQKNYYIITALYVYATLLVDTVRDISSMYLPGVVSMVEILRNVLYIGCVLYVCYLFFCYGIDKSDLLFTMLTVAFWLVSFLLEPKIAGFATDGILLFYSRVYVGVILFRHICNLEKFTDVLAQFMPFTILYMVMSIWQAGSGYMTMSYNLIPLALFNMYYGLKRKKALWTVAGAACFLIAGILGSRGAFLGGILSVASWIACDAICGRRQLTKKKVMLYFASLVAAIIFVLTADKVIMGLSRIFVDSRTLQKILSGTLLDDSQRSHIYNSVLEGIRNEPFFPHGLLADRIISTSGTPSYLTHPHSMVYEIMYQFGIPLGSCVLFWIVVKLITKVRQIPRMNDMQLVLLFAFVPITFTQLMVSSSYLINWLFGITMGLLCSKQLVQTTNSRRRA